MKSSGREGLTQVGSYFCIWFVFNGSLAIIKFELISLPRKLLIVDYHEKTRLNQLLEHPFQETHEDGTEKKKVKKGILKNAGNQSNKTHVTLDYDVPSAGERKSHRNFSGSCGQIDNLLNVDFNESNYSQVKEKSRRRHKEVEDVAIYDTPKVNISVV